MGYAKYLNKLECNEICAKEVFDFNNYCCVSDNYFIKSKYYLNRTYILTLPCCDMFEFMFFEKGGFINNFMYVLKNPRAINVIFFGSIILILTGCLTAFCLLYCWRVKKTYLLI